MRRDRASPRQENSRSEATAAVPPARHCSQALIGRVQSVPLFAEHIVFVVLRSDYPEGIRWLPSNPGSDLPDGRGAERGEKAISCSGHTAIPESQPTIVDHLLSDRRRNGRNYLRWNDKLGA